MARPFTAVVADLRDAIGSYEKMERFFGGNPVKSTWSDWARGKRTAPSGRLAMDIAAHLGCSVAQLHGEEDWSDGFLVSLRAKARGEDPVIHEEPSEARQERIIERAIGLAEQLADALRELHSALRRPSPDAVNRDVRDAS